MVEAAEEEDAMVKKIGEAMMKHHQKAVRRTAPWSLSVPLTWTDVCRALR